MRFTRPLIALFILSSFSVAAMAATCTSSATGNWSSTTTWTGCGSVTPGTSDIAVISTHTVTLNISTTVTTLNISSATPQGNSLLLQLSTVTLTVSGSVTFSQPSTATATNAWRLNAGTGTVSGSIVFVATSNAVGSPRVSSITITSGQLNITSNIVVSGTAPANAVFQMNGGGGQINLQGTFAVTQATSTTLTAGTNDVFNFNGTSAQTIPTQWGGGGYNHLYIQPASGSPTKTFGAGTLRVNDLKLGDGINAVTLTAATNNPVIISTGNVTLSTGTTYTKGTSSFTFSPNATKIYTDYNSPSQDLGWVKIENGVSNPKLSLGSGITVSTISIASGHTFDINGKSVTNSGHWTNAGILINAAGSTITFNGSAAQTVFNLGQAFGNIISTNISSSGLTFSSSWSATALTLNASSLNSSATIYFSSLSTFTVSTFTMTGSAGKYVVLKSTDITPWYLNNTASNNASYVYVSSSNASGGGTGKTIYCTNCIDGGNNTNWNFNIADTFTWTGTVSTDWNTAGNWNKGAVPRSIDNAVIAATANQPTLTANVTVTTVTINSGANLTLNGFNLTCSSITNGGNFIFVGTETVTSVPINLAGSTVTYQTSAAVATNVLSTWTYVNLVFNAQLATYSLIGPISTTENLTITTGTVQTAQGIASTITVSGNMLVDTGAILTVRYSSAPTNGGWGSGQLISATNLTVNANGSISANSQGFGSGQGPGYSGASAGASYGGMGGPGSVAAPITYGSLTNPTSLGSNIGGGAVIISLTGACTINGAVNASGANQGSSIAGSGGTINITASTISGSGVVRVLGGAGVGSYSSGGGRIAVVLTTGHSLGPLFSRPLEAAQGPTPRRAPFICKKLPKELDWVT